MKEYYLVTFPSTHTAMTAQRALSGKAEVRVIPTPRALSESCGISLRIRADSPDEVRNVMEAAALERSLYRIFKMPEEPGAAPEPVK